NELRSQMTVNLSIERKQNTHSVRKKLLVDGVARLLHALAIDLGSEYVAGCLDRPDALAGQFVGEMFLDVATVLLFQSPLQAECVAFQHLVVRITLWTVLQIDRKRRFEEELIHRPPNLL